MTSVDELFKKPSLPSGSIKRKFEAPNAEQAYKAAKLSANGSPNGHGDGRATVEDVADDEDDTEAGPSLPPEDEEGDDEAGRFFGGGVSGDAAEALDYLEQQDDEEGFKEERIDAAWLKRLHTSFEKKVGKNAELRARYEGDAQKFMASEADLDAEIKSWSLLSDHPELYPAFAESGSAGRLVGLLAHENTDIAIGAIEIISELLDEDVEAEQEQWDALAGALLDADLTDLLIDNLQRLDEDVESDRSGVYHSLAVLESLASQPSIADRIGQGGVLEWLCNRIHKPETATGQNKQYAAEVLQVFLQSSPALRKRLAVEMEGVDLLLQLLAPYRKRDPPKDSHEAEFAENVFDALTCVVDGAEGRAKFVEAEGVELALLMLKEGDFSKARALRLLDHATGGGGGAGAREVSERLVGAAGLKTVFGALMKGGGGAATVEHALGVLGALLRWLPGESAERIRTLAKFAEKGFEKTARLVRLRGEYARRVAAVDEEVALERRMTDGEEREAREPEWFSRRLDGGLFCLRMLDVILAWLIAEDAGARGKIEELLEGDRGVGDIKRSLQEQVDDVEDEDTRDMLVTLIGFL